MPRFWIRRYGPVSPIAHGMGGYNELMRMKDSAQCLQHRIAVTVFIQEKFFHLSHQPLEACETGESCVSCVLLAMRSDNTPFQKQCGGFLGGSVVKNPPANAGDTGSIPGPARFHIPGAAKPLHLNCRAVGLRSRNC